MGASWGEGGGGVPKEETSIEYEIYHDVWPRTFSLAEFYWTGVS